MVTFQANEGGSARDKRSCYKVETGNKTLWLSKSSLTEDKSRISKRTTFHMFNNIIDGVAGTQPPAPPCDKCGVQVETSYGTPCIPQDTGEFETCETCGKDSHGEASACWALKIQVSPQKIYSSK